MTKYNNTLKSFRLAESAKDALETYAARDARELFLAFLKGSNMLSSSPTSIVLDRAFLTDSFNVLSPISSSARFISFSAFVLTVLQHYSAR